MHVAIETILCLFSEKGDSEYGGENVTQLQHALQCASLARQGEGTDAQIAAALLHDIGHLLHDLPDDAPGQGLDDKHEIAAAGFLEKYFVEAVTQPVMLHVVAKRYLCTVNKAYLELLSEPSLLSLELQGGLLTEAEITQFEGNVFSQAAVELRKWDDIAKDPGITTEPLESFFIHLERSLL